MNMPSAASLRTSIVKQIRARREKSADTFRLSLGRCGCGANGPAGKVIPPVPRERPACWVRAGRSVTEARNGEEAVELARAERPDLAILDVKMPPLDGIEAARRILADRPIPIVMLTAFDQEELVARAVEAGVFGYLVKPFRESDQIGRAH